jgi:hypothetical protein
MATKLTKQAQEERKLKVGDIVLVYGGGYNSTEFEEASEATIVEWEPTLGMFQLSFGDGHYDLFLPEQLRYYRRAKVAKRK